MFEDRGLHLLPSYIIVTTSSSPCVRFLRITVSNRYTNVCKLSSGSIQFEQLTLKIGDTISKKNSYLLPDIVIIYKCESRKKGNYDIRTNKFSVSRMKEKKNYFDFKHSFIA